MASPPSYSHRVDPSKDRLPPYKASHAFANSQEELAALQEFAESKLYVVPGTDGTLPDIRNGMGLKSMTWGGRPAAGGPSSIAAATALIPETDEERKRRKGEEKERKRAERDRRGSVGQRLMRVISGSSKEAASAAASEGGGSRPEPAR